MALGRLAQVFRDRRRKADMAEAAYWDERARSRSGFARSVWHSETFSHTWDLRQRELLSEVLSATLGGLAGRRIADIGCGTGRITRFLAREGADAVGFDFSPATVDAAREETRAQRLSARFEVADISVGQLSAPDGTFDAAVAVGCLAVACRDLHALEHALFAMGRVTRAGGAVVLLEPIHSSRLLGRVLRASVSDWMRAATSAGLIPAGHRGMGFVPARLLLSSLDLPRWVVEPTFAAGELLLDHVPALERTADYRLLVFRREGAPLA
jgi:SAM-dependent methyltransferase